MVNFQNLDQAWMDQEQGLKKGVFDQKEKPDLQRQQANADEPNYFGKAWEFPALDTELGTAPYAYWKIQQKAKKFIYKQGSNSQLFFGSAWKGLEAQEAA